MDFQAIIKKSWQMVLRHRFLWYLGFLSGGLGTNWFSNLYNYKADNSTWQRLEEWRSNGLTTNLVKAKTGDLGRVLGQSISFDSDRFLIIGTLLVVIFLLILTYINTTAKAAIIRSAFLLNENKKLGFKQSWLEGHRFFWRRLSFAVIMAFLVLVPLFAVAIPVITLGIYGMVLPALILGLIFCTALIIYWLYLGLIAIYAERILLLEKTRPVESFKRGLILFNRNWKNLSLLFLILMAIGIGAGLFIIAAIMLTGALILGLGVLIYLIAGQILTIIYGGSAVLIIFVGLIILSGFFGAFISTSYTLSYLAVVKPKDQ